MDQPAIGHDAVDEARRVTVDLKIGEEAVDLGDGRGNPVRIGSPGGAGQLSQQQQTGKEALRHRVQSSTFRPSISAKSLILRLITIRSRLNAWAANR